jgi:tyrosyl-tRNA synthetase
MLLQSYDFLHLYNHYDCKVQMGGNDQWGNILAGTDLIRRVNGGEAEALTFPLLTTASGAKMGKTERGAIWLDSAKTSPYDYYQYWINTDDRDTERFLALFTFLPMDEVRELGSLEGADIRKAKEKLAFETTRILHGEEEARKAEESARALFSGKASSDVESVPTYSLERKILEEGIPAFILFADSGMVRSKGEARRLVKQGGAYLNDRRIEAFDRKITVGDLKDGVFMLRTGKKKYLRVIVEKEK